MKPALALLPVLALVAGQPVLAQTPSGAPAPFPAPAQTAPERPAGRYQFQSVEGGLARLDTATGEVAICRVDPVLMACDFAPAAPGRASVTPPRASAEAAEDAEFERALGRMKRVFRAFGDIAREVEPATPAPLPNRT